MAYRSSSNNLFWGIILIILGILFLLQNFDYLNVGSIISRYWPIILILLGIHVLSRHRQKSADASQPGYRSEETASRRGGKGFSDKTGHGTAVNNVFGDIRQKFDKQEIREFYSSNVFGDTILNFSDATFPEDSFIRINGVFGDVNLRLPKDLQAEIKTNYVAGSSQIFDRYESGLFKTSYYRSPENAKDIRVVRIEISIVFGDIIIDD
jgi:hypothetical protein